MFPSTDPYSLGLIELMSASLHRAKYEIPSKTCQGFGSSRGLEGVQASPRRSRCSWNSFLTWFYTCLPQMSEVHLQLLRCFGKRDLFVSWQNVKWSFDLLNSSVLVIVSARDLDFVTRFKRRSGYVWISGAERLKHFGSFLAVKQSAKSFEIWISGRSLARLQLPPPRFTVFLHAAFFLILSALAHQRQERFQVVKHQGWHLG